MKNEIRRGWHKIFAPVDFPDVNLKVCLIAWNSHPKITVLANQRGMLRTLPKYN